MSLRAIIIDDDEVGIETLKLLIEKFVDEVNVVAETSNPQEALKLIRDYSPEIVFLDIQMPEMNGFELLEKLGNLNFNLIFTTAHDQHALRALKLNASDYLLKPVDYKELRDAVYKIKKHFTERESEKMMSFETLIDAQLVQKNKLAIYTKSGIESIDLTDVICLESLSNYTKVHSKNRQTLLTPKTLKEFENELCNNILNFMRVHNSYAINLENVKRYVKEEECIIMVNEQRIPLAKSRRDLFFKWMEV